MGQSLLVFNKGDRVVLCFLSDTAQLVLQLHHGSAFLRMLMRSLKILGALAHSHDIPVAGTVRPY